MNSSLGEVILNQVIGALIGTVVSFVISWYFYKKADFPSRTSGDMAESILIMMIGMKLGFDFNLYRKVPKKDLPNNLDVPHITQFFCDKDKVKPTEAVAFLIRVEDSGFNLNYNIGIEVIETSSNVAFPVVRQGHGFYLCKVTFPKNALAGLHIIKFNLSDYKGLKFSQELKFEVE